MAARISSEDLLPEPESLHEHLITQLDYLKDKGGLLARNRDSIEAAYRKIKSEEPQNWTLNISPNWALPLRGPESHIENADNRDFSNADGWALVGGIIEVKNGEFRNYSLSLTFLAQGDSELRGTGQNRYIGAPCCWEHNDMEEGWRVAKRYHFDIDVGVSDNEVKPITHLQSGGKFEHSHVPAGVAGPKPHYCSSPLDKPRLPHPPMDPILIFHMVVTQYPSLEGVITEHWMPRVIAAENELWEQYSSRLRDHLDDQDRALTFYSFVENHPDSDVRST